MRRSPSSRGSSSARILSLGPLAGIIPIFLVTATTLALETSLSGRWKVLVDPDNAKRDYFLELKQEGNKVSGALISPRSGKYPFDGGSFAEGKLRFKVERKREETTQVLTVEAALKDGKLEGTVDIDGASLPVLITRAGSPVAGKWNAVSKSPQGQEHPSTLELAEDAGGALKGKSTGAQGTIDLESVSFDGEKFTFEIVLPIQGNNVPFVVNATLKDANTLSGRWKTKDADISGEWSATREAAKPAAPHAPVEVAKGLAGKWYAVSVLPGQKKMNLQLEIELDGDKVKGKVHMPKQSLEIQNGKASGSKVELSVTYRDDSGEVTVKLEGELKPDDEVLSGKWSSGRGEQGEWSGRKRTEL